MPSCKKCLRGFNATEKRPMVGTCGHTICEPCVATIHKKCPTCNKTSFNAPTPNFDMLDIIENLAVSNAARLEVVEKTTETLFKNMKDEIDRKLVEITTNVNAKLDTLGTCLNGTNTAEIIQNQINHQRDLEMLMETIERKKERKAVIPSPTEDLSPSAPPEDFAPSAPLYKEGSNQPAVSQSGGSIPGVFSTLMTSLRRKTNSGEPDTRVDEVNEAYEELQATATDENGPFVLRSQQDSRKIDRKCYKCKKNLEYALREDEVSVNCIGCGEENIISVLPNDKNKWMKMDCRNPLAIVHFFPMELGVGEGDERECKVCGNTGKVKSAQHCVASGK